MATDPETIRCPRCRSGRYVSASIDGGWTRHAQCVPCGRIHARLGRGSADPRGASTDTAAALDRAHNHGQRST